MQTSAMEADADVENDCSRQHDILGNEQAKAQARHPLDNVNFRSIILKTWHTQRTA